MTGLWIALGAGVLLIAALACSMLLRGRRGAGSRARASIESLTDSTSADRATGAVRSVQRADLLIERRALEEIWTPVHLERLARTYWRFLTRVTLGLIRVRYSERGRSVVLLAAPLRLLSFQPPEYEMDADSRPGPVAHRARAAGRPSRPRRRRVPADRGQQASQLRPRQGDAARRGRRRQLLSVDRLGTEPASLRRHPVADPRRDHLRLSALAGPPGPRRITGGPLQPGLSTERRSPASGAEGTEACGLSRSWAWIPAEGA